MKKENKRADIILRYVLVSLLISAIAAAIVYKMVDTTIVHRHNWNAKADSILTREYFVQPHRGNILADDGSVLATNLTQYDIMLDYRTMARKDTAFVVRLDSLCDSLAHYYPVRTKEQWRDHLAMPIDSSVALNKRKRAHLLLHNATYADYTRILQFPFFRDYKKKYTHGLYYTTHESRVLPYGHMAERGIGRCNYVNVPKFRGASRKRDFADVLQGYSGLEYALNAELFGRTGMARSTQMTRRMTQWVDTPAVDGVTLRTTLNVNMQDIVENELQKMLELCQADWATCILMEVETGDIKALCNLDRDTTGSIVDAMNYAVEGYEPGSVMKPISMIVALEDGFAFPIDKTFTIGSSYSYAGGRPIRDSHSPGTLPVSRFIEYSSNIGMTKLIAPHFANNLNGFRDRLTQLGFFDRFNTGLHKERPPFFKTLDPKAGGHVDLSRMAYGYTTQIPPLYTCAVYNAIANNGRFVRPRIIMERIHPDGIVEPNPVSYVRDQICTPKNAEILRQMIHEVVWGEGGTAKTLRNDTVEIAGKTGTCHIIDETVRDKDGNIVHRGRGYLPNAYRLAFCGFFPYENPKYTCMVLISNPSPAYRSAAKTSGTVLKNIALKMYSRGMLNSNSDYTTDDSSTVPMLYATDNTGVSAAKAVTGAPRHGRFTTPDLAESGKVPNVVGLSMRDAIARVEQSGYRVAISGNGYACEQTPPANTELQPGQTVQLRFTTK